jgi:hypothetical protein
LDKAVGNILKGERSASTSMCVHVKALEMMMMDIFAKWFSNTLSL